MSYEHNLNGKIVVFSDEENYLKCRLEYLEYKKDFVHNEDHLSFLGYIESDYQDPDVTWVVENIMEPDDVYVSNFTISLDSSENSDLSENLNFNEMAVIHYTQDTDTSSSNSMTSHNIVDNNGTVLYTTLIPGSASTTDLNNGWIRTNATYSTSTDTPRQQREKKEKNKYNRFDILDFD